MASSERVKQIFGEAYEMPLSERHAFLDAVCAGESALRAEVEALLLAFDEANEFLISKDVSADAVATPKAVYLMSGAGSRSDGRLQTEGVETEGNQTEPILRRERPGTVIGRYKLLQEIGHGGFGTVFIAEQREPVVRKVALKIVKAGMDTREVLARFKAERQALALMDHPGVTKVFDAGATDSGRPYFVMEHVAGIPINEYCKAARLKIADRLALLREVCQVVQHAHQKGVIHRDLKPSNILVTVQDGRPMPKVIDFGIAKATFGRLTDRTLYTEIGQWMGTPEYMAPEQAGVGAADVDTRADVYSLGVILYELLTGTVPFDAKTLRHAGYDAMAKIIRELEPPKPSTRLSTLAEEAANRRKGTLPEETVPSLDVDLRALRREVRGDLDWIALKALEKDRTRRYPTASALADDLSRHLNHESVTAGPASAAYQFRKLVYRHRRLVAALGAIAFALSMGLTASLVLFFQAREASHKAVRTQRFLQDMFSIVDPYSREPKPKGYAVQELMSEAGRRATTELSNDPEVRAAIQHTIGTTYLGLGLYQESERFLGEAVSTRRRILGESHPDTLDSLGRFAGLLAYQGRYEDAEAMLTPLVSALARTKGEEHRDTLMARIDLAWVVGWRSRYVEAAELHEKALADCRRLLGTNHETTLHAFSGYAWALNDLGRADRAEPYFYEAMEISRRILGDEHLQTLRARNNYARNLGLQGKFAKALPLFEENVELGRRLLDEHHPWSLIALGNLGWAYTRSGRAVEGEPLLRTAFTVEQSVFGPDHLETMVSAHLLAQNLVVQNRNAEAENLFWTTLEVRRRVAGDDHANTIWTVNDLGHLLIGQNRYDEAEELLVSSYNRVAASTDVVFQLQKLIQTITELFEARGETAKAEEWRMKLIIDDPKP